MGQSFFSSSVEDTWQYEAFCGTYLCHGMRLWRSRWCGSRWCRLCRTWTRWSPWSWLRWSPWSWLRCSPAAVGVAAAPIAYGAEHYSAGPVVPHAPVAYAAPAAPAPYTTSAQAAGVTTVHQPAPIVTKQVHLGQTSYVSGYATKIHKPATPHLPIAVPTVLKGTHTVNAPIVKTQTEIHNVQDPVFVERKVDAPYDAPFHTVNIVEVPTPVH